MSFVRDTPIASVRAGRHLPRQAVVALAALLIAGCQAGSRNAAAEVEMIRMVNETRSAKGLRPLRVDARLTQSALEHTRMVVQRATLLPADDRTGAVGHWGDFAARTRARGYAFAVLRENVAGGNGSLELLHRSLLDSPGHYRNIISSDTFDIGVGVIEYKGWTFATQVYAAPRRRDVK